MQKIKFNKKKYYLIVGISLIVYILLLAVYFFSPLSSVSDIKIFCTTNYYSNFINKEYFKSYLPKSKIYIPTFNALDYKKAIENSFYGDLIENVKIKVTPFSISVYYKEVLKQQI